jgi:prepilin-type N-terminal cleavage/methylation domain-containing protein
MMRCDTLVRIREKGNGEGFTFLEVLVALAVVSISIVALLNCHTVSLRNYLYSQIISRATLLAEERINQIESGGVPEIDDSESEEYDNGLRYVIEEGEFYDEEQTDLYQPSWRLDYWWRSTVEDTDYDGVRKITVEVFSRRFVRESVDIDPWDNEQISPTVRLVTYIATTNRREDARSGPTQSSRRQPRNT